MRERKIDLADGRYAVIRTFLKNRDRSRLQRAALGSRKFSPEDLSGIEGGSITLEGRDLIEIIELQVELLLLEYCGNTTDPFNALMESEYEDDYMAISEAVGEVVHAADKTLKTSPAEHENTSEQ